MAETWAGCLCPCGVASLPIHGHLCGDVSDVAKLPLLRSQPQRLGAPDSVLNIAIPQSHQAIQHSAWELWQGSEHLQVYDFQ